MAQGENVGAVPIRRSVVGLEVEIVQQRRDPSRPVVKRPAVSVRRGEAQSLAEAFGQAGLQRVIVAGKPRCALDRAGGASELSVQRLAGGASSRQGGINLPAIRQLTPEVSGVADRRDQTVSADVMLNQEVVVLHVWRSDVAGRED